MKKFTFFLVMMLAFAGFTMAQTIENFEPPFQMNLFSSGSTGYVTTVANPDSSIANPSLVVGKMLRAKDGDRWQGWWTPVAPIDVAATPYLHIKIWKPRVSPTDFKLEAGVDPAHGSTGDVYPMAEYSQVGEWQELVYDFSAFSAYKYKQITLIPDFPAGTVVGLTDDIDVYFDDIYMNNDPTVGSDPVLMFADFEHMKLNLLLNDPITDLSSMTLVANPDKSGGNASDHVIKYLRDKDGQIWGGFWSPTPIDMTNNTFVHVKVWKPRISPVAFHFEGGTTGNGEPLSMYPQTKVNEWQDMVWDCRDPKYRSAYTVIGLQPDKIDPVDLTDDIIIYFDDIVVNNDSTPRAPTYQVINIDMTAAGLSPGDSVYMSGTFGGEYLTWVKPGTTEANRMIGPDANGIYTDTVYVNNGSYELRFYIGKGWRGAPYEDPAGNKKLVVNGGFNMNYSWGLKSPLLTLNVDMHGAGLTPGQPVYFGGNFGGTYGSWDTGTKPGDNINNMLTDMDGDSIYTAVLQLGQIGDYEFKFFKGAGWDGGEWAGGANRMITVKSDTIANYVWGMYGMVNNRVNPLAGQILMYPNPVRDNLTISTTSDIRKVMITNTLGKVVGNYNYTSNQAIDTRNLSNGMYFVTFIGRDGNKVTQKLIKD